MHAINSKRKQHHQSEITTASSYYFVSPTGPGFSAECRSRTGLQLQGGRSASDVPAARVVE